VRVERSGRDPVLAGEHLWQEPMGTIWQHSVTTAKNLLHHQASAGGTSIFALSRSSLTACETPPGFSRWYLNFLTIDLERLVCESLTSCEVETPPAEAGGVKLTQLDWLRGNYLIE
jgi:hypothetical protein